MSWIVCLALSGKVFRIGTQRTRIIRRSFDYEGHLNSALKNRNELEWGMGRQGNLVGKSNMQ